jgi:Fe2+ transport system protein B
MLSETMEDWDQETLEKVVESKKNEYSNQNKPTDIVRLFRFVGIVLHCLLIFSIFLFDGSL